MGFNNNPYIKIKYANTDYSKVIVDNKTVWRKPINYIRKLYIVNNSGAIKNYNAITAGGMVFNLKYSSNNNNWYECLTPEENNTSGEDAVVLANQRVIKYEDELKYIINLSNGYEIRSNSSKIIYNNGTEVSLVNNTSFIAYDDFDIDIRIKPILYSLTVTVREGIESYKVYRTAGNIATIQGIESGYITTSDKLYYGDVLTITAELQEGYTDLSITSNYNPASTITVKGDTPINIHSRKIYGYYKLNKDAGVVSAQVRLNGGITIGESYSIHYGDVLEVRNVVLVEGYYLVNFVDTYTFLPTQDGEILNINITTSNLYKLYLKNNSRYTINNIPAGETALYGTYAYGSQVSIQLYCEGSYSEVKYIDIYEDTTLNINCEKTTRQHRQWITLSTPAHIQEDTYKSYGSFKEAWYNKEGRKAVGWYCGDSSYYGFNPISRPEGCTWVRITWDGNYYAFQLPQQSAYNDYTPNTLPWGENGDSYGFDFNLISPSSISIGYNTYYLEFNAESFSDGDSDYYNITVYMTVPESQFSYSTYKQKLQNLEYGTNDLVIETTYRPYFED